MSDYFPTIGLEVHAELATATKMFCRSKNDPDEKEPNVNICPVCMAHPGTLPVINKAAVRHVLRVGTAVGGSIADFTEFDRKNYFYPDIPKGYQISQYKYPLISGGTLNGVALTRIHLEEDTARSQHEGTQSLIDYNRAGVPLMELVTEPVIHDSKTAGAFARELQLLLRYLGASEANMEKGEMRVEANISISKDPNKFGTKVEVKNINSFSAVERAIEYELKRHEEVLESGGTIAQETRGWDDVKQKTFSQRTKENAFDYRYFPDPDLPKLKVNEIEEFKNIKATLPELPWERRERLSREFGLRAEAVEIFVNDEQAGTFFEHVAEALKNDKELSALASNYITTDIAALTKTVGVTTAAFNPVYIADLVRLVKMGEIGSRGAKDLLALMAKDSRDPKTIAEEHGLFQKSDAGAIEKIVDEVIATNAAVFAEYKAGKAASLQFLIGQGMKLSKGSANPGMLKEIFEKKLS
ncbi:MAG: Asp-tRNA(Asn)/Glu-tRNA(Gln) amidotransferase subunit GatB [Patescibacteria group bacterium]